MKFGIISDVHANAEALASVRIALQKEKVDSIICLGDTVGYGGSPEECCILIRSLAAVTVLGNHDAAVAGKMNYNYYYDSARKMLDEHAKVLNPESISWLQSLPYTFKIEDFDILFCHGSPLMPEVFDYVFEVEHAQRLLEIYGKLPSVTFIGHSHLYRCYVLEYNDVYEITDTTIRIIRGGQKHIISVGSVGQPRDMDNRAGFVIYDSDSDTVIFKRVEYDIETASQKIMRMNVDKNFSERLLLGW